MNEVVTIKAPRTAVSVSGNIVIPAAIADAGEPGARYRFGLATFAAVTSNY
jgi:hypothetical protein